MNSSLDFVADNAWLIMIRSNLNYSIILFLVTILWFSCNEVENRKINHSDSNKEEVFEISEFPFLKEERSKSRSPENDTLDFFYFKPGTKCHTCIEMDVPFKNPFALFFGGGYMILDYKLSLKSRHLILSTTSVGVDELHLVEDSFVGSRGDAGPNVDSGSTEWFPNGLALVYKGIDKRYKGDREVFYDYKSYHKIEMKEGSIFHYMFEDYLTPKSNLSFEDWKRKSLILKFINYPLSDSVYVIYNNKRIGFENQR